MYQMFHHPQDDEWTNEKAQCKRKHIEPSTQQQLPVRHSPASNPGRKDPGYTERRPTLSMQRRDGRKQISDFSDLDTQLGGPSLISLGRSTGFPSMNEGLRERLEEGFKLHNTEKDLETVFRRGSVIAVFWHENLGLHPPPKFAALRDVPPDGRAGPDWLSRVDNGTVYSHKRCLVIVNYRRGFSIIIPITSYGGKGLTSNKPTQTERDAHAIIYALGNRPRELPGEPKFTKTPIGVKIIGTGETLSPSSSLYYGKPQSIDHNVKVKHVGYVVPEYVPRLLLDYRKAVSPKDIDPLYLFQRDPRHVTLLTHAAQVSGISRLLPARAPKSTTGSSDLYRHLWLSRSPSKTRRRAQAPSKFILPLQSWFTSRPMRTRLVDSHAKLLSALDTRQALSRHRYNASAIGLQH